ncbi:DNA alkylation repair protein [Murdochiella vaginalis]|uniref:DNA alkylation repair protein n=1 Tax=Murdochiella vaginalis TaxID=1852373 RepID=UPI0008FEA6ED|nr:DNA alkylation repair protein [Murdochiella vaginalis]
MHIIEELFALQDVAYAAFQAKLTPNIPRERFIGVRVPEARKLAKRLAQEPEASIFLSDLPHTYYDENILHSLLLSEMTDYDACVEAVDAFLPYVDNWAVCDILSPKIFKQHKTALLEKIKEWSASEKTYTCRFGLEMLLSHFLDEDFKPAYLEIPASVHLEEYYVRMMIAWFFATALAKQWDATIEYLEDRRLDTWTHNKTIQKARESRRITPKQKEYLKTLKR